MSQTSHVENETHDTSIHEITRLIEEYKKNKDDIYYHFRTIDVLREKNKVLEREIYKNCEHSWERDYDDAGPYSSTSFFCKKCTLYR